MDWRDKPGGTKADHWIDLISVPYGDGNVWREAQVKWDGCIHYTIYRNDPGNQKDRNDKGDDYVHICSIDELIRELQALKAKAKEHFGEDWPK